jgi:hypothetical protein
LRATPHRDDNAGTMDNLLAISVAAWTIAVVEPAVEAPRSPAAVIHHAILDLGNPHFAVRQAATERLFEIGLPAVPALAAAARSGDLEVAVRALRLILRIGRVDDTRTSAACAAALQALADSSDPVLSDRAARALEYHRRFLATALVRMVVELEGSVSIRPSDGPAFVVRHTSELPAGTFVVTSIDLRSATGATSAALRRLGAPSGVDQCLLSNTAIDDDALEQLATWRGLQQVYLERTAVTDAGLRQLTTLPDLRTLWLTGTSVSDAGLRHVSRMAKLTSLDLESTQVTAEGLVDVAALAHLTELNLRDTQVTDEGLRHIARLPRLQSLSLAGTAVTDAGLVHLAGLQMLDFVDLRRTNVSDAAVQVLRSRIPGVAVRR